MLGIAVEKVCEIIAKARAFDSNIPPEEPETGVEELDEEIEEEDLVEPIETPSEDPIYRELLDCIDALNEEEQINLVALTWVGRGDYSAEEWEAALQAARDAHTDHTGEYLLGIPIVGDFLEEGLSALGYSCSDLS